MKTPLKLLLVLLSCVMLIACGNNVKSQLKQSVTPTINCGESVPDMKLPAFPEYQDDIEKYSEAQTEWAVEAAGVFKHNRLLRQRTKDCLDGMRQKGFIN